MLLLVVFNGFFAGSEIAFISVNETKLKILEEDGDQRAKLVLKLKGMPNKFLSTIQIGVSIASIFSGVFAAESFASLLTAWILTFTDLSMAAVKTFSMFFITLIISYLMLLFGELVPKRVAMSNPRKFAYIAVYPLSAIAVIATPLIKFLSISTNLVLKLIGIDPHKTGEEVTEEEIRHMVETGEIDRIEKEMIESIFEFDDMAVTEIMTHRTEVVAIDSEEDFDCILDLVNQERFTRYPVYQKNIDNIIGTIHLRDLLRYIRTGAKEEFVIGDLLREAYFVPDSKRTDQLFRELQMHKTHMAIVIDEYGGTAGIVTMENLIEEIMGDILDEYDEEEEEFDIITLKDGEYLVDGAYEVEDLEEILKIGLPIDNYETVNGFIVGHLGRIPTQEDVINNDSDFKFNGYLFSITDIDEKVVSKVKITKLEDEECEEVLKIEE